MKALLFIFCATIFTVSHSNGQYVWEHTDGPSGSSSSTIFSNDTFAFVPEDDLLFRSSDGITWEKIKHRVSDVYAVHGDTIAFQVWNDSLQRLEMTVSPDNGLTWIESVLPTQTKYYGSIAAASHGIYVVQGLQQSFFFSPDLGLHWEVIPTPLPFAFRVFTFDQRVYVRSAFTIMRSDTLGQSWDTLIVPNQQYGDQIRNLLVRGDHIHVTGDDHIFSSMDDGNTWNVSFFSGSSTSIQITASNQFIYALVDSSLFFSMDQGLNWNALQVSEMPKNLFSLTMLDELLLVSTVQKGIYRYAPTPGTFIQSNSGLDKGHVNDLEYSGGFLWAACGAGLFHYSEDPAAWRLNETNPAPDAEYHYVSSNENGAVCTGQRNADFFYYSPDHGLHWQIKGIPGEKIKRIVILGSQMLAYANYNMVFHSSDTGKTWSNTEVSTVSCNYNSVLFRDKILVLGFNGNLYESADNGKNWTLSTIPISAAKLFSSHDQQRLFAFVKAEGWQYLLYQSDNGVDWILCSSGFPPFNHLFYKTEQQFLFYKDQESYFAFLGEYGHYISHDDGLSWTELPTTHTGVDYIVKQNIIYLGRNGAFASLVKNPLETSISDPLYKNYTFRIEPNPAGKSITIHSNNDDLPPGKISILSYTGVSVSSNVYSGFSSATIDVSNLPNGLYYVIFEGDTLTSGGQSFLKVSE